MTDPRRDGRRGEQVADALRDAIVTGELEPGDRLVEGRISEQLQTSRGPVRDALRQLEHEGLVASAPYRGAVVLIPIRLVLERFSFLKAIPRLTDGDFEELAKQVWVMGEAARRGDLPRIVDADLAFHEIVLSRSGMPHTMQVWRSIQFRIRAYFHRHGRFRALDEIEHEHRQLLEALQTRDPDAVLAVLEPHIAVASPPA
jgi:DNA-binding GntR family transcriptional regulator